MGWYSSLKANGAKLRRLTPAEWCWLGQALVLLPASGLALRLVGFQRWQAVLGRFAPRERPTAPSVDPPIEQTARMVRVAAAHGLAPATCLEQSLALWWLLRREGVASEVRVGVRKGSGRLEAHAWVEVGGRVLNDRSDVGDAFAPFSVPVTPEARRTA
jgi:hypothetical protein